VEEAVNELHNGLGVQRWLVVRGGEITPSTRDPRAPLWWDDDEEASASFLKAMGIGA
jgi:hypothetical protein